MSKAVAQDFKTCLEGIEFQAARLAENPNFDMNLGSTRNLMKKKGINLLTAIVKFFNSTLLYLNQSFFG